MSKRTPAREDLAALIARGHERAQERKRIDDLKIRICEPAVLAQRQLAEFNRDRASESEAFAKWAIGQASNPSKAAAPAALDARTSAAQKAALESSLEQTKAATAPAMAELDARLDALNRSEAEDHRSLEVTAARVIAEETRALFDQGMQLTPKVREIVVLVEAGKASIAGRYNEYRPSENTHYLGVSNEMATIRELVETPAEYTNAERQHAIARWQALFNALLTNPDADFASVAANPATPAAHAVRPQTSPAFQPKIPAAPATAPIIDKGRYFP